MGDLIIRRGDVVVVADGRKALILVNEGDAGIPNLQVLGELDQDNPPTREQGVDRPGRLSDTASHRSAVQETDWHRVGEERFARDIADKLHELVQNGTCDRLILAAAPRALGDMRKALHKDVESRIVAQVDKDLTKHPVDQIEKLLAR